MKLNGRKFVSGFSLIELSIVIVVIGLLGAIGLESYTVMAENNKISATKKKLDEIEIALAAYLRLYGNLPCPASRGLADSNANFGKSQANCETATLNPAGTDDIDRVNDDENVRIGVVPVIDMGLPKDYAFDGWGNTITYAVIKDLAYDTATYEAFDSLNVAGGSPAGGDDGIIMMQDRSGNQLSPEQVKSIIPYVLVSHGKDGKGGYNKSGNLRASCAGVTADTFYDAIADAIHDDIENCDNADELFIADGQFDVSGAEDYYDDYVRYKTKEKLEADAAKTTVGGGGSAEPGGDADYQVQYNLSGAFEANAGLTFNPSVGLVGNDGNGTAMDFRWKTDTLGYGIFADASANKVSIGMDTPTQSTSALTVPSIEFTYDNTGVDTGRFVRIDGNATSGQIYAQAGGAGTDLYDSTTISGSQIELQYLEDYGNGSGDDNYYATITADGAYFSGNGGYVQLWAGDADGGDGKSYLNFGPTKGTAGYGVRDNAGQVEYKNSGGSWSQPKGYTITGAADSFDPADGQTIYWGSTLGEAAGTTANISRIYIPRSGTIRTAYIYTYAAGVMGTAEVWSSRIRVNNTTDYTIQSLGSATRDRVFKNENLSITVGAGDYIEIKMINPTWATNPTNVYGNAVIYID